MAMLGWRSIGAMLCERRPGQRKFGFVDLCEGSDGREEREVYFVLVFIGVGS